MNKLNYKYKNLTPFKLCVIENFPFIEADFDAITNYQLLCKVVEYLNKTIDNQNVLTENIIALNNWFNNLDVQEEINNKLDAMLEDGTLPEIITQYIKLSSILIYDNVESMKSATNVVNGSVCQTLGFYTTNDGGGATYKIKEISNTDVVDNMTIIPLDNESLIAQLVVSNEIIIEQLGAVGDGNNDDTQYFQKAVDL